MAKRLLKLVELPHVTKREAVTLIEALNALKMYYQDQLVNAIAINIQGRYKRRAVAGVRQCRELISKLKTELRDAGKQTGDGPGTDSGPSGDHGRRREKLPGALGRIYAGPR